MDHPDEPQRFSRLLERVYRRRWPGAVHVVQERGLPAAPAPCPVTLLYYPRLSLCLSERASYTVVRNGEWSTVTLKKGEVIATLPDCVMEPHADASYTALGIVFTPEMTRYLLAKKKLGKGRPHHRFLYAHHSPVLLDEETRFYFQTLAKRHEREPTDRYLCNLMDLILIKAREMLEQRGVHAPGRKAAFTYQAACQFVKEHLNHPLGREEVADFLRLHPNHVSRLFTQFGGCSFSEYLRRERLALARQQLKDPTRNISEVARACGFTDANYFIRCYRKAYGVTPGQSRGG